MKKLSLKNLLLALLFGVAVPCVNAQTNQVAHIGDILCEGNYVVSPANFNASSDSPIGVVFYVDNVGKHGWAIDLQDAGSFKWGTYNLDTPLTNYNSSDRLAIYDLDGYRNTEVIYAAYHDNDSIFNTDYQAFSNLDFENGWYLPAIGQLNYLYGNLIEVNAGLYTAGGTPFETGTSWRYWSSTEFSASGAWYIQASGFIRGDSGYVEPRKNNSYRVRAARNFSIGQ